MGVLGCCKKDSTWYHMLSQQKCHYLMFLLTSGRNIRQTLKINVLYLIKYIIFSHYIDVAFASNYFKSLSFGRQDHLLLIMDDRVTTSKRKNIRLICTLRMMIFILKWALGHCWIMRSVSMWPYYADVSGSPLYQQIICREQWSM